MMTKEEMKKMTQEERESFIGKFAVVAIVSEAPVRNVMRGLKDYVEMHLEILEEERVEKSA